MKAVYLLGSERSGSNLLRTLLGNHSQISAPIAPHLCDVFIHQFKNYLPLKDDRRKMLLNDINAYVNHEFNDWDIRFQYNESQLKKLHSFVDFLHFSFSQKAISENKICYFSKDNHNHRYALGILKDIPEAKFIYLYRDPRDHVSSWMRTPIHLHTPYVVVNKWRREQEEILKLRDFYGVDICFIKYEDLVMSTEKEMSRLLSFLSFPVEKDCFQTKQQNKEASKHPLWKNINKPIKQYNYKKYRDLLILNEINMIETLTAHLMIELEYKAETKQNWKKGNPYLFYIREKLKAKMTTKKK
jgi:hypothetical protein